jgi:C-terminal processing protease CtpA/Prc
MVARAGEPDVRRVVLDIRQNPGGDNHHNPALVRALGDEAIDSPGRLFVLTDRVTFSAASNLATDLEQQTSAIFAGEQMGGGLNFWNDVRWVGLPNYPVPMRVGVSTRYWQLASPDDPRLTIEPELAVPARAADYFAGRDAVLETVEGQPPA